MSPKITVGKALNWILVIAGGIVDLYSLITILNTSFQDLQKIAPIAILVFLIGVIYFPLGLQVLIVGNINNHLKPRGVKVITFLAVFLLSSIWMVKFLLLPILIVTTLTPLIIYIISIIGSLIFGLIFSIFITPLFFQLANQMVGVIFPFGTINNENVFYPVACLRLIAESTNDLKIDSEYLAKGIERVWDKHKDLSDREVLFFQIDRETILVSFQRSPIEFILLVIEIIQEYKSLIFNHGSAPFQQRIAVGVDIDKLLFFIGCFNRSKIVPSGVAIEHARLLSKACAENCLLITEEFNKALNESEERLKLRSPIRKIGAYLFENFRTEVYDIYKENIIGQSTIIPPNAKRLSEDREWRYDIIEALNKLDIKPWPQLEQIRRDARKLAIGIDGVISIEDGIDSNGWNASIEDISITYSENNFKTYFPSNWGNLIDEIRLEPGARNRSKVFFDNLEFPISDRYGRLRIEFGKSTYQQNRLLENLLNENQQNSGNTQWTTFEWKPENQWKKSFIDKDGSPVDLRNMYFSRPNLFWNYLPNMVIITPVVITGDAKIIFGHRSEKVRYYPSAWSITFEEQIDPDQDDIQNSFIIKSIDRGLKEELGIPSSSINQRRILSVYREWHNGNLNILCIVSLNEKSNLVSKYWKSKKRDKEIEPFYEDLDADKLIEILIANKYQEGEFHPGSRYRLLMTLIHTFGYDEILTRLNHLIQG